jgi:O-glycosyl hydrolase
MTKLFLPSLLGLLALAPAHAAERATYHSGGGLTGLIHDGAGLAVRGEFVVRFEGGVRQSLQPHDQRSPILREGSELKWKGVTTFPNGGRAQFEANWRESDAGITLDGAAISGGPQDPYAPPPRGPLMIESLDYVIDLPRPEFAGGRLEPAGTALPTGRPGDPTFFSGQTAQLAFTDAHQNWRLTLALDHARPVTVTDRWDADGRSFRVRVSLGSGPWSFGEVRKLGLTLKLTGKAAAAAARITVDPTVRRYAFDGFGGNYCFNTLTPAADYTLDNLRQAWVRFELKGIAWDRQRSAPGPELVRDFELMQRVQQRGRPWIISLWRLPEHYYADANQKPPGTFNRQIAADRWPEFLDLIGSYLVYLKKNYGAEPDFYSFNEPDLGVDIGFTAEGHRDMIKRIGAHLASLGLKTKMLLGETANPRDSHNYVLATAADPEAMKHVGALSFHSWGNGSPQQYRAWAEVAQWIGLPLLVGEAGTDPGSWRNRTFDSFAYGLGEMRQFQELLRDAAPTALIYWQFTEDYGLVRVGADQSIEPTGRFWMMKHFTDLTPPKSDAVASTSDQPDVLVSAFARGDDLSLHILNTGARREATIAGLPPGPWQTVTTTETEGFQTTASGPDASGGILLPARSLTTLVRSVR